MEPCAANGNSGQVKIKTARLVCSMLHFGKICPVDLCEIWVTNLLQRMREWA
jgi:hypothetical protein